MEGTRNFGHQTHHQTGLPALASRVWQQVRGNYHHLVHFPFCRRVFDIAVDTGARYDNPARMKEVKRARVRRKELRLPEPDQFVALIKEVRESGSGFSPHCADAIEFFSYAGPRLKEAARIFGRDCSFTKNEIVIRSDGKTGTKNWENPPGADDS